MSNKKILFISNRLSGDKTGASRVAQRNFENLCEVFGKENMTVYLIKEKNKLENLCNSSFFLRLESINLKDEKNILRIIEKNQIKYVFIDTSCFGFLSKKLESIDVKTIIFCHDITKELYSSLIKTYTNYSLKNIIRKIRLKQLKFISKINEKLSFKYSDMIITLNGRDSDLLKKEYNYDSNLEIPVSFPIKSFDFKKKVFNDKGFNLLFVGVGGFQPNIEALKFFIDQVLPKVSAKLNIVGKNMENYAEVFNGEKINLIGTVDDLDSYYLSADAIIAPIFSGGGMKVKTAEALMYGKTIFGTTEAFEGYELDYDKVGGFCNTADEFVEKINKYIKNYKGIKENNYSRSIFIEKYSYEASRKLFKKMLEELEC